MANKKKLDKKIIIQGESYGMDSFKPHHIDEFEICRVLRVIEEVGEFSVKGHRDMRSIVRHSPLLHIEGLIRFQLIKRKSETHGLCLEYLETTSDFLHQSSYVDNHISCPRIVFLFNFLYDIVSLSNSPEYITREKLDKIKSNLRTLNVSFESQITGARSHENKTKNKFEGFAYYVWKTNNCEKIKPAIFWDKAIALLKDNFGEIELGYKDKTKDSYVFLLEPYKENVDAENKDYTIKISDPRTGKPCGDKTGHRKAKAAWSDLQKEFILQKN